MSHSILFFTKFKEFAGTQKIILILAEVLQKRGYSCMVVVSGEGIFSQKLKQSQIPFIPKYWKWYRLRDWVEAYGFLRSQKWDAVFMHHNRLFSLLCKACGIPVIQRVNVPTSFSIPRWGTLPGIDRFFSWFTDHFITPSKFVEKELLTQGIPSSKVTWVPNGIELEVCTPLSRASLGLERHHFVIGSIGRLEHVKGHDLLLAAFHPLIKKLPHARLILIGSGSRESFLKTWVREQRIESAVVFLPHQENIFAYYPLFDLLVLPSRAECLANVLLEAALCGCPLLASNRGGNDDFVKHEKSGILVDPENTETLMSAMEDCHHHKEKWKTYAEEARVRVEMQFTKEIMAQKTIAVIEKVIQENF